MALAEMENSSIQAYSVSDYCCSMEAAAPTHSQNGIETPLSAPCHTFSPSLSHHNGGRTSSLQPGFPQQLACLRKAAAKNKLSRRHCAGKARAKTEKSPFPPRATSSAAVPASEPWSASQEAGSATQPPPCSWQ